MDSKVTTETIEKAAEDINGVAKDTPLQVNKRLSNKYNAKVYLKREDLQEVRSYKIRGAYNFIKKLSPIQTKKGVVTASAGNHAQGVAYSAKKLGVKATIFMPTVTPLQKINRVADFGGNKVKIVLFGRTYDESYLAAKELEKKTGAIFVHPFNDPTIISGQGTVGKEIAEQLKEPVDYVFVPVGGGGLVSGVGVYIKTKFPKSKIIGVEPEGAPSLQAALKNGSPVRLANIDTFVDGASVRQTGKLTFEIAKKVIDKIVLVSNGKTCSTMIELYQNEGVVAEPAGALAIAALDNFATEIAGKTCVCILSGGNNDLLRYPEVLEKSLLYEGRKHYFLLSFAQKPGQLREFLNKALGPTDDIVRFEYIKKTSKELGPALVGIEFQNSKDYIHLVKKMEKLKISYTNISDSDLLYSYLI